MIWQDVGLTIIGIVLSAAMVPQVYYGFKEKKGEIAYATSVPTFLGLYVVVFIYVTLHLYFSAIVMFITANLWLMLLIQRRIYGKR